MADDPREPFDESLLSGESSPSDEAYDRMTDALNAMTEELGRTRREFNRRDRRRGRTVVAVSVLAVLNLLFVGLVWTNLVDDRQRDKENAKRACEQTNEARVGIRTADQKSNSNLILALEVFADTPGAEQFIDRIREATADTEAFLAESLPLRDCDNL